MSIRDRQLPLVNRLPRATELQHNLIQFLSETSDNTLVSVYIDTTENVYLNALPCT